MKPSNPDVTANGIKRFQSEISITRLETPPRKAIWDATIASSRENSEAGSKLSFHSLPSAAFFTRVESVFASVRWAMTRGLVVTGLLAAVSGAALAGWMLRFDALKPVEGRAAPTPPEEMPVVKAFARVVPTGGLVAVAGPAGERLLKLHTSRHAEVKAGDRLAWFESYPIREAECAAADAACKDALSQKAKLERSAATKQEQLTSERVTLEETIRHRREAEAIQVDLLRHAVEDARAVLAKLERLAKGVAVSEREIESQRLALRKAESELKVAELADGRAAIELERGLERIRLEEQSVRDGLAQAVAALSLPSHEARLAVAIAGRDRAVVTAPIEGKVIDVITREGETPVGPFLRIADTSRMSVLAEVWESQVGAVSPGQHAVASAAALPGERLEGRVTRVGRLVRSNETFGLDPAARSDGRVIEVEIALGRPHLAENLINLQVDVEIHTGKETPAGTEGTPGRVAVVR